MSDSNVVLTIPEPRKAALDERSYPRIVPGFSLVEVEIAPICIEHQVYKEHRFEWHSDEWNQGHEGVGTIIETTEASRFEVGDRVVIYQGNPCGECVVCRRGLSPTHCMSIPYEALTETQNPNTMLEELGGGKAIDAPGGLKSIENVCGSESGGFGFSKYRIAPDLMIQKIPDDLPFRYAALANCSLGCTYTAFEVADIRRDDWVLVAGVGFIGFGSIINAKYRGAKVIVLGRNPVRMELAQRMGADHVINPEDEDWLEQVHALTGDQKGVDLAIEASGYPFYQRRALHSVRRFGWMYMYGFLVEATEPFPIMLLEEVHNRGVKISGSHDVYFSHREGLVRMLRNPEVQQLSDHMITHEYNMSQAGEAFEEALSQQAGKLFLYPQENCPNPGPNAELQELRAELLP